MCTADSGDRYVAETLILATGAQARWLGLPSEQKFAGHGVSACATCDGFFFRNRPVAVVGGGNTAVEEALYLSQMASRVILIHRRDQLRAEKVLQDRLFRNPKIEIIWDSVVEEILGREQPRAVTGVRLRNVRTGATSEIAVEGVFIAIGHDPATELVKGQLEHGPGRLRDHGAEQHGDQRAWRVRGRRRAGQDLPPGGHGRRQRLHGGAGGGEVPRGARAARARDRVVRRG